MPFTPTVSQPIDLAEVYIWLRLDMNELGTSVDGLLTRLSVTALSFAEECMEATIIQRARTHAFHVRPPRWSLPYGPVQSITSVTDGDGNAVTGFTLKREARDDYLVFHSPPVLPVTIVYVAGEASINEQVKTGMLCHVEQLYRNADGTGDYSGIERCYAPFKRSRWVG